MRERCTVCVVDVTGGRQKHVRKITLEMASGEVLEKILELFAGQMVRRGKPAAETPICAENERSEQVKG